MNQIAFLGRKGGGGGGGGGTTVVQSTPAIRTPDNLRSEDAFEIILGLGEGEWDACENFLVGETYLYNADGSSNFNDFRLLFYPGTSSPSYTIVPTLGGISRGVNVGVTFYTQVPIIRTTQNGNIDFIDIRLVISQLFKSDDKGTYPSDLSLSIQIKPESSTTWTSPYGGDITISGKTTSAYVKELRFPVSRINENYDIKIVKLSPESGQTTAEDGTVVENSRVVAWDGFEEVTNAQYKWPNTAIAHLTGRASNQFSSLPQFSGIYRGKKVRVPTNYDPASRTYDGIWDGTFKIAWTNNPAWCLYDYVTDAVYGLSTYFPVYMDKYSVYEAAQWCDVRTSDGRPRYTLNQLVSEPRSAREQAIYMAGVFNAVFFDDQDGTAFLKVDKEEDARHLFAEENTIGGFSYSFTDLNTRYNDITVAFTNPDLSYQTDRRRVFNQEDIDKNGRVTYDFIAVGCDNAPEAVRRAAYKLLTGLTETMSVSFRTNRKGMFVQPWEIILIADSTLGYAISGRVKSLDNSRTVITLRDPIYLEVGVSYTLNFDYKGEILTRTLITYSTGNNYTLGISEALPSDLPEYCTFSVEGGELGTPKPFRVLKITESEGDPDAYEIHAIEVNRNKWTQIDNYEDTTTAQYSFLPSPLVVPGPTSCSFTESFVRSRKEFRLQVDPRFDRNVYKYFSGDFEVWSRPQGSTAGFEKRTLVDGDTVVNHPPGNYEFRILGKSLLGGISNINNVASYYYEVTNPSDKPADVSWLSVANELLLWEYPTPPLDFAGFELRYQVSGSPNWANAKIVANGQLVTAPPYNLTSLPRDARVVLIKAVDYFGNYSNNAAFVQFNLGDVLYQNVVVEIDYKTLGFPGTKTNCEVVDGNLISVDDTTPSFYSGDASAPIYSGDRSRPFYKALQYQQPISYIQSFTVETAGYLTIETTISGGDYTVQYRKLGGFPFYGSRVPFYTGDREAPFYRTDYAWLPAPSRVWVQPGKYELRITTPRQIAVTSVTRLKVVVDVDDVVEYINDVTVPEAGVRLPLKKQFSHIVSVNCTLLYDTGDAYSLKVIDQDPLLGPLVKVYSLSGAAVTGRINAIVQGYYL